MAYVERRVAFDHERDSDIIDFLDTMTSHRANQLIRQLIRGYMRDEKDSRLDKIESKVDTIMRDVKILSKLGIISINENPQDQNDEELDILTKNIQKIGI